MTVLRFYEIACDACHESYDDSWPHLMKVRKKARAAGWVSTPNQDLCPDCARANAEGVPA